jgi:hypothetical protein
MEKLSLSARAYHRILRVARTIGDLEGADAIETHHMAEAVRTGAWTGTSHEPDQAGGPVRGKVAVSVLVSL